MNIAFKHSALAVMAAALAAAVMPSALITPSAYAEKNIYVADGPHAGSLINLSLTPYLREPLNFIADACPDNKDVFRKSKQVGATEMVICGIGYSVDAEPADLFLIEPTSDNLKEFSALKLAPTIEASPAVKAKIKDQTSRSAKGSTARIKKFPGGSLLTGIATSSANLRGKTRKKVWRDEASEYPKDLAGQGAAHDMISGAYETFLASADFKDQWISTPTIRGDCAISDEFEGGDQRYWHVRCPHCCDAALTPDQIMSAAAGAADVRAALRAIGVFYFDWDLKLFRFKPAFPYEAHYVAPCCGGVIDYAMRTPLMEQGIGPDGNGDALGWIATAPGPGKHRSRHFDALSSRFVPWDTIAERFIKAGDDPGKLKTFYNLTLGLPYDVKGDAPDYKVLMARRVEARLGMISPGALLLTIAADVQKRGIYVEALAHAPDQQSWPIFIDYLDGPTTDVDDGAFVALTELYRREWPDAYGHRFRADEFVIDANYHTQAVYEWTRRHPGTKAIKGADGWRRVPLGVATDQDVDYKGKKIKGGAKLRLVGTWDLKSKLYEFLAREPIVQGASILYPPGYCHFGQFLDDTYFRQLTAEYLADEIYKGRPRKIWKQHGGDAPNHYLDCRIYNMAAADAYFAAFTAENWAERARERGIPADLCVADLFAPKPFQAVALKPVEGATQAPDAPVADSYDRLAKLNAGVG